MACPLVRREAVITQRMQLSVQAWRELRLSSNWSRSSRQCTASQ